MLNDSQTIPPTQNRTAVPVNKAILVTVSAEPTIPANPVYMFILEESLYSEDITPYNEETNEMDTSAVVTGKTSGATAALAGAHASGPALRVKNISGTFVAGEEITVAGKTAKIVSCDIKPAQVRVDLIRIDDNPMAIETEHLVIGHGKMYPNPYEQVFSVTEGEYKLACYNVYEGSNIVNGEPIIGTFSVDSEGAITSQLPSSMTIGDPPVEEYRPM
jgi:hypothetical protein